jgi:hypothetical protein
VTRCNPALPVGHELYPDIEVRQRIEGREAVQQVPTFDAVHAAEDHVTLGDGPDRPRSGEILAKRRDLDPEAHATDSPGHDVDLRPIHLGVLAGSRSESG